MKLARMRWCSPRQPLAGVLLALQSARYAAVYVPGVALGTDEEKAADLQETDAGNVLGPSCRSTSPEV